MASPLRSRLDCLGWLESREKERRRRRGGGNESVFDLRKGHNKGSFCCSYSCLCEQKKQRKRRKEKKRRIERAYALISFLCSLQPTSFFLCLPLSFLLFFSFLFLSFSLLYPSFPFYSFLSTLLCSLLRHPLSYFILPDVYILPLAPLSPLTLFFDSYLLPFVSFHLLFLSFSLTHTP